jgi:hypothetical protein
MSLPDNLRNTLAKLDTNVPASLKGRLVELWLERGQNEHASIASFDRFSLGLLAVGSPPDLIEAAHAAAIDEIRHAQVCFAIASAYAGAGLGPGKLDLSGTLDSGFELGELVEHTVIEGCVGETLSALEAKRTAEETREPAVKAAMTIIATDEMRHSELAWAFVRWAVERDASVAPRIREAFAGSARNDRVQLPRYACAEEPVQGLGFLLPDEAYRTRIRALEEVVRPAAEALGFWSP